MALKNPDTRLEGHARMGKETRAKVGKRKGKGRDKIKQVAPVPTQDYHSGWKHSCVSLVVLRVK